VTQAIQILVLVLLSLSIVAVIRLWSVLGSVRVTLANLEDTRQEADKTLQRLSEVAASTDKVMREEVAPTLQLTRATLENVEITTRALAQTTQAVQRLTGHAESLTTAQRLLSLGGTVAQGILSGKANKNGVGASHSMGVAFAVASRLRGLFGRRKESVSGTSPASAKQQISSHEAVRALPDAEYEGKTLTVGQSPSVSLLTEQRTNSTQSASDS
jgi:hypothetical protein